MNVINYLVDFVALLKQLQFVPITIGDFTLSVSFFDLLFFLPLTYFILWVIRKIFDIVNYD